MNLVRLVVREILYRRLNAILILTSVIAASGWMLGAWVVLNVFDLKTEQAIAAKEAQLEAQMAEMEDAYRKITKRMGFNVLILPKDQELGSFYAENYADTYMPEAYAERLASARNIVTIRHLLPMLQQKLEWPEQRRKILLIGVRGEMAWAHKDNLNPIVQPVAPGTVTMGYELHRSLGVEEGQDIVFMGKAFRVTKLQPERGTIDDITMWIDLDEAQELLDRDGQINAMMALECKCAWANLPRVRAEIQAILPDTQVLELAGKALARAEARLEAQKNAVAALERERAARADMKSQRERLLATLVPIILAGCALWVAALAFINVRDRQAEIGVLRAVGLRTRDILFVFLSKYALLGVVGTVVGTVSGALVASGLSETPAGVSAAAAMPGPVTTALVALVTIFMTLLAGWVPALYAAQQDPADILREE